MRKLFFGLTLAMPMLLIPAASALPGVSLSVATANPDFAEVKGGRGRAIGWSKGKKVGWRGRGCPPGLAKQGRC